MRTGEMCFMAERIVPCLVLVRRRASLALGIVPQCCAPPQLSHAPCCIGSALACICRLNENEPFLFLHSNLKLISVQLEYFCL